jgi:plastocyanin
MTAVAAALAVAAGGLAATQVASARPAATTLTLSADSSGKLKFNKSKLTAKHGAVTIKMANPSSLPHAVAVQGKGVDKDGKIVKKGGTSAVTVTLKKGTYSFYCPVPGHKAAGMKGTLTVT